MVTPQALAISIVTHYGQGSCKHARTSARAWHGHCEIRLVSEANGWRIHATRRTTMNLKAKKSLSADGLLGTLMLVAVLVVVTLQHAHDAKVFAALFN
jgi:hypothetical protein